MTKFKDNKGDEWELSFHLGNLIKACEILDISLEELQGFGGGEGAGGFGKLKLHTLLQLLPAICEDQMIERGINGVEFKKLFGVTELQGVFAALTDEISEAFPEADEDSQGEGDAPLLHGASQTSSG